jgi:hypothetical protein
MDSRILQSMGENCTQPLRPHHRKVACLFLIVLAQGGRAVAEEPASRPVSFRAEIAPLLQRRCATCHNEESAKGGYRLDSFAHLLRGGDSESLPVVAGKAKESELYQLLIEPDPHDRMPQKADPLPAEEKAHFSMAPRQISLSSSWHARGSCVRPRLRMGSQSR